MCFTWIYAVIAVVGLYILSVSGAVSVNVGDLLTLGCAVIFALHSEDRLGVGESSTACGWRVRSFSCARRSPTSECSRWETPVWRRHHLRSWFPIVYAGVFSGGVAYTMQILGQQSVPPTIASMIMSLESVFAALFGWLIGGQTLSGRELIGCAIRFAAIVLADAAAQACKKKA